MILMGWGPFRFSVPTYSVEAMSREFGSRVESVKVIGARPPTHLLGPDDETVTLESTFHPYHYNVGGRGQLEGVRIACAMQSPMMLVAATGFIFGRWVCTKVSDKHSRFAARHGGSEVVTVNMTLQKYVGDGGIISIF